MGRTGEMRRLVSRVCHDPDVMQRVYDIGRKAGEACNLEMAQEEMRE